MPNCLQLLLDHGRLLGVFDPSKVSGLPPEWFWTRRVGLIDFRGDLQIRSNQNITFGFGVKILTASHDISQGGVGEMVLKKVWIDPSVFVGSFALLYNCYLMEGSVVACGSVVRNMTVQPYTMVEGNPAKPIKIFRYGSWIKID